MGWRGLDVVWKHAARNDRRQTSATAAIGGEIDVEWDAKHEEIRGIMNLAFQGFLMMLTFSENICVGKTPLRIWGTGVRGRFTGPLSGITNKYPVAHCLVRHLRRYRYSVVMRCITSAFCVHDHIVQPNKRVTFHQLYFRLNLVAHLRSLIRTEHCRNIILFSREDLLSLLKLYAAVESYQFIIRKI